jgi:acetyl esterase/lipase
LAGCKPRGEELPLWPEGAPGAEARRHEPERAKDWWIANIHAPSLTLFRPDPARTRHTAVIILPGGGHRALVFQGEGVEPARFLARRGFTAFALKYRLAHQSGSPYTLEDARADALRAVRWVRYHAQRFDLDPTKVGVMGWSAGAELTALLSYGNSAGDAHAPDPIDRLNARPSFQIAIYPVRGVPKALPADAPATFLLAAVDDPEAAETVRQLHALYRAAQKPAVLHLLPSGGHGFNMGQRSKERAVREWPKLLEAWLDAR